MIASLSQTRGLSSQSYDLQITFISLVSDLKVWMVVEFKISTTHVTAYDADFRLCAELSGVGGGSGFLGRHS
jgi:hypothetical protein